MAVDRPFEPGDDRQMTYNLADLFEQVVDAGPERTVLVDAT